MRDSSNSSDNTTPTPPKVSPESRFSPKKYLEGFSKWKETIFLTSVAGMSILFGFGATIGAAKKQDPEGFDKGMTPSRKHETGVALASRALKWGTIYAVGGCGILFFTIWKLMGVKDMQEFGLKMGGIFPRLPKKESKGRTEFENLTDLLQYIIDEDDRSKAASKLVVHNSPSPVEKNVADVTSISQTESVCDQ